METVDRMFALVRGVDAIVSAAQYARQGHTPECTCGICFVLQIAMRVQNDDRNNAL